MRPRPCRVAGAVGHRGSNLAWRTRSRSARCNHWTDPRSGCTVLRRARLATAHLMRRPAAQVGLHLSVRELARPGRRHRRCVAVFHDSGKGRRPRVKRMLIDTTDATKLADTVWDSPMRTHPPTAHAKLGNSPAVPRRHPPVAVRSVDRRSRELPLQAGAPCPVSRVARPDLRSHSPRSRNGGDGGGWGVALVDAVSAAASRTSDLKPIPRPH